MQSIKIYVSIEFEPHHMSHGGLIMSNWTKLKFRFNAKLNGIQFVFAEFVSKFSSFEEKEIAEEIARFMMQSDKGISSYYGNFNRDEPYTVEMIYSQTAKEIFDAISKYKPKLLPNAIQL